ncbi:MAG: RNA methyltransferase [Gammaproteobacteria bacterium]|nr:RNA methyltransferase [Gammaproteobacteria bacterium]
MEMTATQPRFVLVAPTHPGNIGAAARAIKTMGFARLVLVAPACDIDGEARARSSGALDVLLAATQVATLDEAIGDCGLVIGASARQRTLNWPEYSPRECAAEVAEKTAGTEVAILFGPERAGLTNDALDRCHGLVYIPSNPEYNSLNLAMAVQVIAYELRLALAERPGAVPSTQAHPPARAADLEYFYGHLERALVAGDFIDPENPRHLMRRLRRLFNRARLDSNELAILRGMLSALAPGSGDNAPAASIQSPEADG